MRFLSPGKAYTKKEKKVIRGGMNLYVYSFGLEDFIELYCISKFVRLHTYLTDNSLRGILKAIPEWVIPVLIRT